MKLYKEYPKGNGVSLLPCSLSDLKAALKEYGMVAVPVEPTEAMVANPWLRMGAGSHSIREIYKAMIKAAEEPC